MRHPIPARNSFRFSGWKVFFVLCVLGFVVYSNTFRASFQFDDIPTIVDNSHIRDLSDLPALWNAFNTRFLIGLSLAFNYSLGKLDVFGYHLFNLSVHILASFLVYFLTRLTFATPVMAQNPTAKNAHWISFFAALIFLAHPLQTQAVTYIWQRSASLAAFFYLAAMLLYAHARISRSRPAYGGSILVTFLAMFTKEICFTLPLAIALYECFFFGEGLFESLKQKFHRLWPFLLCLVIIPLSLMRRSEITMNLMRSHSVADMTRWASERAMPRKTYLLTQLDVLRTYLRLLFFPVRQNLDYDYPLSHSLMEPRTLFSCLVLLLLLAGAWRLYRRQRLPSFCICWFFLALSVESLVVQNDVIFEHRLYLPMAAFSVFLATTAWMALRSDKRYIVFVTLVVLILSFFTYRRNGVWADNTTLWTDVVQKSPHKARGYVNLASYYEKKGDHDKAISTNLKAIELAPNLAIAYYNLGVEYYAIKRTEKAIEMWQKAVQLDPKNEKAFTNLANGFAVMGDQTKAIAACKRAIEIDPQSAEAYVTTAISHISLHQWNEAVLASRKAIEINPKFAEAYNTLGIALQGLGNETEAVQVFRKAIALDPEFSAAKTNLKEALNTKNI